ncbi:MAG: hypothetical protein JWR07_5455 [Nevskia sp.]|nr:hypothetical protein [Nevskia sp.]
MRDPLSYGSAEAALVIGRILGRLAAGPADTKQLIAATHRTGPRARGYIAHLADAGRIYCLVPQKKIIGGGTTSAVWALDPASVEQLASLDEEIDKVDDFRRRVIVRTSWEPNHVRMPLDCYLFGVPAVLQGVAA